MTITTAAPRSMAAAIPDKLDVDRIREDFPILQRMIYGNDSSTWTVQPPHRSRSR